MSKLLPIDVHYSDQFVGRRLWEYKGPVPLNGPGSPTPFKLEAWRHLDVRDSVGLGCNPALSLTSPSLLEE